MIICDLEICEVITLKVVWKILDGVGDAIDGTVEEISDFLFERLNKQAEGGEVKVLVHLISAFYSHPFRLISGG